MDITEHNLNEETTILLTIGRMNPPTTGHLLLIKTMLQQALRENLSQINIILSQVIQRDFFISIFVRV